MVNKILKSLISDRYSDEEIIPTSESYKVIEASSTQNTIILAAGYGMRNKKKKLDLLIGNI